MKHEHIHALTPVQVLEQMQTSQNGLSAKQAQERLMRDGLNVVKKQRGWSCLGLIKNQFNNALVWILLVAASLSFVFHEYRDVVIILVIVGINAVIGFLQEFKAERTLESIRKLASDGAVVVRDGVKQHIDASNLVVGDVIVLSAGDRVPADAILLESFDVYVNEFIFTGESKPTKKIIGPLSDEQLPLAELKNTVFMGTALTRGQGLAVVTAIGMDSQLGKIANMVALVVDEETPLQKQMRVLGRDITALSLLIAVMVLIAGHYYDLSWYDNFLFALALAVSVVPEGLPAAISVALSLGMRKLLKDNVLAKKLNAVETLASVSIICSDKTGTITRNELMVTEIVLANDVLTVDGEGYAPVGNFRKFGRVIDQKTVGDLPMILRIGTLCNDCAVEMQDGRHVVAGDPTEGAILVAGRKYSNDPHCFAAGQEKIDEIPFSSDRMRMNVVYRDEKSKTSTAYVKGSPDVLLGRCTHILINGSVVAFSEGERKKIQSSYNEMSSRALRVLAFAYRPIEAKMDPHSACDEELIWVGMMAMIDPPRKDVPVAIQECRRSGISVIMITGDYELTAEAIAKQVGIIQTANYEVINGKRLDQLSDEQLHKTIKGKEVVFARITPEQKLRIATLLRKKGAVIAMTGDGVNDAPALKKADIGIAMGVIGTDVAKEASDMILLDDDFASIVKGIKEGRTINQNLRKFVHYVFTSNASEFFTIIIGVILQVPAPISAVQILAVDLGTDIFPSFSLSLEPSEPNVMQQKPVSPREKIMTFKGVWRIFQIAIIMAAGAVIAFILSLKRGGWDFGNKIDFDSVLYIQSTSAAYAVLAMSQMANLLQSRSEKLSVFTIGFFKNKYAIGAIIISVFLLLLFQYLPFFQKYLRMSPIAWQDWVVVAITTLVVFIFEEARKAELKR